MKIRIIKDLSSLSNDVYFYAWQINDKGEKIYCLEASISLERLEEKLIEHKKRSEFKPEIIKEIEI